MNVGDYIRIDGYISKIGHIKTSSSGKTYVQWKQPNGLLASANIKLIEKSSPQIIDLIKVGDYVNGYLVIEEPYTYHDVTFISVDTQDSWGWGKGEMPIENIKSIITHEQFGSMKYEVK